MIEFVSMRDDGRDLSLFGNQKPLQLTRAHRRIDGNAGLVRHCAVDLGGDRVQPADALAHCGVSAGQCVGQRSVGFGDRAVLTCQRCLSGLNGG